MLRNDLSFLTYRTHEISPRIWNWNYLVGSVYAEILYSFVTLHGLNLLGLWPSLSSVALDAVASPCLHTKEKPAPLGDAEADGEARFSFSASMPRLPNRGASVMKINQVAS